MWVSIIKLACLDSPIICIGQTGRCFKTIIEEHCFSFIQNKPNSNNENHQFDNNFEFKFRSKK